MRKGYTIIEMLTVIFIMALLSAPLAQLTMTTMRDIPRAYNVSQSNTTVLNAMDVVRDDISVAVDLPKSFGSIDANETTLLIRQSEKVICYKLLKGELTRNVIGDISTGEHIETHIWTIPKAVITWEKFKQGDDVKGLAVKTHIAMVTGSITEKLLGNSYLFFLAVKPESIK